MAGGDLNIGNGGGVQATAVDNAVLEYLQQNNKDIDGVNGITMADVEALGIEMKPGLEPGEITFDHNENYPMDAEEVITNLKSQVQLSQDALATVFQQSAADVLTANGYGDLVGEDGSIDLDGLMSKLDSGDMSTEQLIFMMIQLLEDAKEKLSKNGINMLEFEQSNLDAENEKMLDNILDQIKDSEKAEKSGLFMEIFGWIALAVAAPFLAAAGPGGWAVLAIMVAIQCDAAFNEGKGMAAVTEFVAENFIMPLANDVFGADISKEDAMMAASIIITVVIAVASIYAGGGAASSLDDISKNAGNLAKAADKGGKAARLADDAARAGDDVVSAAATKVQTVSGKAATAADDLASAQKAFTEATEAAANTLGKSADEVAKLRDAANQAQKALKEAQGAAKGASDELAAASDELANAAKNCSDPSIASRAKDIAKEGSSLAKDLGKHGSDWTEKMLTWSMRLQTGTQAAAGGVAMAHAFNERDLAETQAESIDIQAAISAIQQMIDDLMDLLTLVQESKSMGDEVVATFLQDLFKTKSMPWRNSV